MLEGLKRRSAEERWQRVKTMYPADPPAPRRKAPSRLPDDHQADLGDEELPPSPAQMPLIPRLSALPADTSSDWVLPVRQPILEDDAALANSAANETGTEKSTTAKSPSSTESASESVQEIAQATPTQDKVGAVHRNARTRKISDIDPFYDRTRDQDMREFAMEKGKEFGLQFKPKPFPDREFPQVVLAWEATNFYCNPLYFSDPALERYGHTYHPLVQPAVSIARAGTQFIFLPYQMTIDPICKEEYMLGWYRPGECAPKLHYQVPLNAQAAAVQAGVVTGLYFAIP